MKIKHDGSATRGHPFKFEKRYCQTATQYNLFSYRIIDSWNRLQGIKALTLNSFKAYLDKVWSDDTYLMTLKFPLPQINIKEDDITSDEDDDQLTGSQA